jgi:hypothetical protein
LNNKNQKEMKNEQFYHKQFPKDKFPQLYSKRGFEKSRIKICIPKKRDEIATLTATEKVFEVDKLNDALRAVIASLTEDIN